MNKDYFEDIFNDFFKESETDLKEEVKEEAIDINKLNIDEESKSNLLKIVKYINNYDDTKRFIPFNLCLNVDNDKTVNDIIKVISNKKYTGESIKKIPLYDKESIPKAYENSGIVVLTNLKAIDIDTLENRKKTLFILDELIKKGNKTITILVGTSDEVNNIFGLNDDLKSKFIYTINGVKADIQDVYLSVLKELNKKSDVKLLDYIKLTYPKVNYDYDLYKKNLIDHILLNDSLPTIEKNKDLNEIFEELDSLVGLDDIKKTLKDLADLISLKKKSSDLKIKDVNMHMVFLGNPGTGKTTVARLVKDILYNLGYIKENKLIEVTSKDLVGEYVGQTSPKTQSVIDKALGGILFVDEAYTLSTNSTNSYNQEAIMTLIENMENKRDNLIVIFAGYTKEMQEFLNSNSGISSRIGYTLNFKDYTDEELITIFNNMMSTSGFNVEKDAIKTLKILINKYKQNPNFGNARFIRNVYEKTIIKHANNTKNINDLAKLKTITKEDISDEGLIK